MCVVCFCFVKKKKKLKNSSNKWSHISLATSGGIRKAGASVTAIGFGGVVTRKPTGHWSLPVGKPHPLQPLFKADPRLTEIKEPPHKRPPKSHGGLFSGQALFLLSRLRGSAITKAIPDSMDMALGHHLG